MKTKNTSKDKTSAERILNEIWDRLQKADTIRSIDLNNISVEVDGGEVLLTGHLATDGHKQHVESIVMNIPGVTSIRNELVGDRGLKIKVSQTLAKDPRTRPFFIFVGASHGWVHLGGNVPSREDQMTVEEVTASIPEVRGVVSLPYWSDKKNAIQYHVVQPSIGAKVYDRENSPGRVNQVIIDPHNRLVIGAIVEAALQVNGGPEQGYYFITSKFMKLVNEGRVSLDDTLPDMTISPLFNQVEYVVPPEDWHPPFPYKAGEVLWLKGESDV